MKRSHNPDLSGKDFRQFPKDMQEKLLGYKFSVDILPRTADDADVLQIFKRIKATGLKLNYQELRNAEYFGYFAQSVHKLSLEQLDRWRRWKIFNENEIARMEEVEFSGEIYILILQGLFGKTKSIIDRYYRENDDDFQHMEVCEKIFRELFDKIEEEIGETLPRLTLRKKALFFNLVAFFHEILYGLPGKLDKKRPNPLPRGMANALLEADRALRENNDVPEAVQDAISRRTTHIGSRRNVLGFLKRSLSVE